MKKCFKCGAEKPLSEFYKHSAMKDGYLGKCKECTKNDSNKHRADNLESCRAYDRERANLPHRVELRNKVTKTWIEDGRHNEAQRRYKEKYPEKYHAHNVFCAAKRDGKILVPECCSLCGVKSNDLEAHHKDYSKPLDVQWLCVKCHSDTRRKYPKHEPEKTVEQQPIMQMKLFEQQASYSYSK